MAIEHELLRNIDLIHTTELGVGRIKNNLGLTIPDVIVWCKEQILSNEATITRQGKNWYVAKDDFVITVNAYSYTVITAHKRK